MAIPRDPSIDATPALLRDPYGFVPERCRRLGAALFATRLMLRPAVCMQGEAAARLFYEPGRFVRAGAMPPSTLRLLQDLGSVQMLEGAEHRHRKAMFMAFATPAEVKRLTGIFAEEWRRALRPGRRPRRIRLLAALRPILTASACRWAGVPPAAVDTVALARQLAAMVDHAGGVGPSVLWALWLRGRAKRWAEDLLRAVRRGSVVVPAGSPVEAVARHRDPRGEPLAPEVAAVELLNLLRPTVAVDRFVVFAAMALDRHPDLAAGLGSDEAALRAFVQEVRRTAPYFPLVGGRAAADFEALGHRFAAGDWCLVSLYGTDHDPAAWPHPDRFDPARFAAAGDPGPAFVPQGGGDPQAGHRCPGERATVELVVTALRLLLGETRRTVPAQDRRLDLSRAPARPADGFVIELAADTGGPVSR